MIANLVIQHFRNLKNISIRPGEGINIFYGLNGSGKTSLLEAIHFLGLGRSFRTHSFQKLIQDNASHFLLFTQLMQDHQSQQIGVERFRTAEKKMRLNGENLTSLASVAQLMPIQLLSTDCHRYFHDGPKSRRQYLDGGVFHVEPLFYSTWKRFQKALEQRNAGLKNQLPPAEIAIWNSEISASSHLLDQYRQCYVNQLIPILNELLLRVLPEFSLNLHYSRGWPKDKDLADILRNQFIKDLHLGYTQFGPQRADLQLYLENKPVSDFLSQGQQKVAAYALHLAQGLLMQKLTTKTPIYLIDDLPSELDSIKRKFVASLLGQLQSQVFITAITAEELKEFKLESPVKKFHVEHGMVVDQP